MADLQQTPDLAEVSLMDAFGGRRGVLDSGLPPLTFISAYLISGSNLTVALVAALLAGLAVTGWRLATHDTLRHALAGEQTAALDAITALAPGGELLLEGVAASGKTDVYLAAVRDTIDAGRSAIVLVPDTQRTDRAVLNLDETIRIVDHALVVR